MEVFIQPYNGCGTTLPEIGGVGLTSSDPVLSRYVIANITVAKQPMLFIVDIYSAFPNGLFPKSASFLSRPEIHEPEFLS